MQPAARLQDAYTEGFAYMAATSALLTDSALGPRVSTAGAAATAPAACTAGPASSPGAMALVLVKTTFSKRFACFAA
jgi:hypothetical protein